MFFRPTKLNVQPWLNDLSEAVDTHKLIITMAEKAKCIPKPFELKALLEDIEKCGKPRSQIVLSYLADKDTTNLYDGGVPGKLRAFQRQFDQLKRKTPEAYFRFIDSKEVSPGPALLLPWLLWPGPFPLVWRVSPPLWLL